MTDEPEERFNRGPDFLQEIDFVAPCPVQQCINKNEPIAWQHVGCKKGKMKLTDSGELRCTNCIKQGPFVDWRFDCGDHDYEKASYQGVGHALSIMSQLAGGEREQMFIANVTQCVMRQFLNLGE